ncbi:MAG: channel protein hemolysin family [Moraxellaceae bacterium]|jgi:hemolysin III|nr:channel protein hemolysin family [Moraxellaceae bacterium]
MPEKPVMADGEYTLGEEIANAVAHGLGAVAAIVALTLMIVKALPTLNGWQIAGISLYGGSLVLLFLCSTLYHSFTHPRARAVFRRMDHSAIFLLIAGTYTPFLMLTLQTPMASLLLIALWVIAIAGVVFKIFFIHRFKRLSLFSYLAMGWLALLVIADLYQALPAAAFTLLVAGGLCYTVGTFFYATTHVSYTHAIWHLFVLGGAASHCVAIGVYVIPGA